MTLAAYIALVDQGGPSVLLVHSQSGPSAARRGSAARQGPRDRGDGAEAAIGDPAARWRRSAASRCW